MLRLCIITTCQCGRFGLAKKRIGILTGGGDVAGLNAVIKSVTYRGSENGIEVIGLRRGWEALTHLNLEDPTSRSHYLMPLNRENTRTIDRSGGTVLHSSRINPSKIQKLPDHLVGKDVPVSQSTKGGITTKTWDLTGQALANLSGLGIGHLIAIGGDDTLIVLSEGAAWEGYKLQEYGEPDAYGHRKKANVAEALAAEIKRLAGEETIVSDLTYDLRSGDPDFIDKLVALTFGNMAYDAILEGKTGLMSALVEGRYDLVPIPDAKLGPRKLDVATTYNTERYRPIYANKLGLPIFLNRAS